MIRINFDGLCENGVATRGWLAKDGDGKRIADGYGVVRGQQTNNVAEYQALIEALQWAVANGADQPVRV